MRIVLIFISLLVLNSISYAETYKWEDSTGIHYTDNPASVPIQYRSKTDDPVNAPIKSSVEESLPRHINANYNTIPNKLEEIQRANAEQSRLTAESIKQQQFAANELSRKQTEKILQDASRFFAFWVLIGIVALIVLISVIIDIVRSEFTNPTNKIVWILLVLFFGPLGVLLYLLIGLGQKKKGSTVGERERVELLSRLYPDKLKEGKFDVR